MAGTRYRRPAASRLVRPLFTIQRLPAEPSRTGRRIERGKCRSCGGVFHPAGRRATARHCPISISPQPLTLPTWSAARHGEKHRPVLAGRGRRRISPRAIPVRWWSKRGTVHALSNLGRRFGALSRRRPAWVIDNDGLHGNVTRLGDAREAGLHRAGGVLRTGTFDRPWSWNGRGPIQAVSVRPSTDTRSSMKGLPLNPSRTAPPSCPSPVRPTICSIRRRRSKAPPCTR